MGYHSLEEVIGKHHHIFVSAAHAGTAEYKQFWQDLQNGKSLVGVYQRYDKEKDVQKDIQKTNKAIDEMKTGVSEGY